jgi:nicotinamidase-related amidase
MPPLQPDKRATGAVHDSTLPQWAIDKMARRRGRRYAYEVIDPSSTALVIVDLMQNFVDNTPCAASIVGPIEQVAECVRNTGGVVAWVQPAPSQEDDQVLSKFWGPQSHDDAVNSFANGLQPDHRDIVAQKEGYSAFFPGKCDLPNVLTARHIDTVIITGVLTNICCESSARDAAALGYQVIVVSDANAARSDEEHQAALYNILRNFGDVRESRDLISLLTGCPPA